MIKNRAFAVNIFLSQVVEHENADFMNGFRNFRKIPSRGGAREREKYKVFSNNFFLPRDRAWKLDFYEWFWKFLSHLVGIEKDQKLTTLINFFFLPQRVAIEKRQKLRVELYFYVPQWVEHETSVFMRFFRKYFVFGSKLAYLISCWKNEAPNWRRFSSVASKLMPRSGAGFLPWHQNWCHFDYLLTYSQ